MQRLISGHRSLGWMAVAVALLTPAPAALDDEERWLSISATAVESLEMPYSERIILNQIEKQYQKTQSALFIRGQKFQARGAYDGWKTTKQELAVMARIKANQDATHQLNLRRQREADIEDTKVLDSHNRLLERDIAILEKRKECKAHLLRILELANVQIIDPDITRGDY